MVEKGKIPVIVGVTGHRNIAAEDRGELRTQIVAALEDIKRACSPVGGGENTPVIMLNAFAQGADMLCAEAAFDMGIDVFAVLPRSQDEYIKSFTDPTDREKLFAYLGKVKRVIVAPDFEGNREWLGKEFNISGEDYEYRQAGIYIAEYSHILLALWDGKEAESRFGCGTVEVIKFALNHDFLNADRVFSPGAMNDSAVLWINARRAGAEKQPVKRRWLVSKFANEIGEPYGDYRVCGEMPQYLSKIIEKTAEYNAEASSDGACRLWKREDELDEYRRNLSDHYSKADSLSFDGNQKYYNLFILLIAIIGTFVAFSFMLYDDAALTFMILPCALAVGVLIWIIRHGHSKGYHEKYIEYRAVAEAFRIQFYMSLCLSERQALSNVCRLYSWTQKVNSAWIYKALQAIAATSDVQSPDIDASEIIDVWIGNSEEPKGQMRYHTEKLVKNRGKAGKYNRISKALSVITVGIYAVIFIMEATGHILNACGISWFWEGLILGSISWRSAGVILMGTATAASLLFASYFGKLSFDRKAEDNLKMGMFYSSAYARWQEAKSRPSVEKDKFVKEIAREEIIENGIWCSYVKDNSLEINI